MIIIATTGIWKIDKRLDHVIDYITNIEKTINENYGKETYKILHNLDEYDDLNFNTEKQYYVSGINCSVKSAYEEMLITKKQYNKTKGILGFHSFQSFKENEVTPEQAHEIGLKLAEEMWGDRFEVVVSTHVNTNHIHNHFVINSVSFKDGKKYYDNRVNYARLRQLSDSLCEEYNLSVLEEKPCRRSKINYANYYNSYIYNNNYYVTAKEDIDRAISQAYSYKDFEKLMKAMDYEIIYRGKNIMSIRRQPYKKNIRVERNFGSEYSIERIKERIEETYEERLPFIEEYGLKVKKRNNHIKTRQKHKGLYGLYLYYCYLLKIFPQQNPRYKLSPSIRIDVDKMQNISEQTKLLVSNKITTYEQFFSYSNKLKNELDLLLDKRSKLWYKHKKSNNIKQKEEIRNEISSLFKEITNLRKEVKLCDEIEERSKTIEKNVCEFEKQLEKEEYSNEFIK